jgi:hypothetical protein
VSMVCSSSFQSKMFRFIVSRLSIVCLNLVQSVVLYVIFVRVRFSLYCPSVFITTGLWSELSAVGVVGLLIVTFLVINRSIVVGSFRFRGNVLARPCSLRSDHCRRCIF